ncbi:MAG TPA: Ig-like domain-containing protein, partial [Rhodanobacteraceae bacterium]|nr:Ig-like domain-containing protein [Rhodanobacteraceae bacterium]
TRWDITLLFSDTNPAGPFQVSFAIVTPPTHGSVVLHGRTATYMPTLGYAGADSFTYTASTINGTSNVGTAGLTVLPGKLPLAQAGSAVTPYETPVSITLAASDANPGGPFALAYAIVTPPQHGSIGDFDADAGTLTYTPDSGYYGADEFRFNAATVNGTSAPATVSLAVIPPPPQLALAADAAAIYARYGQVLDYTFTLTNDGGQVDSTVTATFTPSVGFDESYAHIACFGAGAGASCEPDVADPWRFNVALPPGRSLTWFVSAPVRYDTSAPDVEMAMSAIGTSSVSIARASTLVIHRDGFEATDELLATRVDGAAAKALLDGDALREIVVPRLPAKTTTLLRVRDGARELRVEGRELAGIVLVRLREVDARGQQRASAWGTSQVGDTLTLGSEAAPNPSQAVADGSSRTLVLVGAQLAVRL